MPLVDEISALAMIKLFDYKTGCTNMIKVTFIRNTRFLEVTNNSSAPLIFGKDETVDVVHLRSIEYYKEKQSIIQHHVKPHDEFKPLQVLC